MKTEALTSKEKSRLKYQKMRQLNQLRSILVVDNAPLKKKEISLLQKWFRKIEKVQISIRQFNEKDQKLFSDWHQLTFHSLLEQIEKIRSEYFLQGDFHNQMLWISKQNKMSIPKSYLFLQAEQDRYDTGDAAIKAEIDAIRLQRTDAIKKSFFKESSNQCDCEDCRRDRGEIEDEDTQTDQLKNQVLYYELLTEKEIIEFMYDFDEGHDFVMNAFKDLFAAQRMDLVEKIWDVTPAQIKKTINQDAKKNMGKSMDTVLEELKFIFGAGQSDKDDDWDSEPGDWQDFQTRESFEHKKQDLSEDQRLRIKITYRNIIRRIHPDRLDSLQMENRKFWLEEIWKKSVDAHKREDLEMLTQLYDQVLVAFQEFDGLGITALQNVAMSLQKQHKNTLREISDMKSNPAWNFSQLKNYEKLEKKLARPYLQQLSQFKSDLDEIMAIRRQVQRQAENIRNPAPRKTKRPKFTSRQQMQFDI